MNCELKSYIFLGMNRARLGRNQVPLCTDSCSAAQNTTSRLTDLRLHRVSRTSGSGTARDKVHLEVHGGTACMYTRATTNAVAPRGISGNQLPNAMIPE